MALTLNGRKSRFKAEDWMAFARYVGLNDRQRTNVHQQFRTRSTTIYDWINISFLTTDNQQAYQQLINQRARQLGLIN